MTEKPEVLEKHVRSLIARCLHDEVFATRFAAYVADQAFNALPLPRRIRPTEEHPHFRSIGVRLGRMDLHASLRDAHDMETALFLTEIKINCALDYEQLKQYEASKLGLSRRGCPAFKVLCAPQAYLRGCRHAVSFDARIPLEVLLDWVTGEDADLLRQAIKRHALPPQSPPDVRATGFHDGYWGLANLIAPELVMQPYRRGEGRPKGSRTMWYNAALTLPPSDFPSLGFLHQCWDGGRPAVKVLFRGWARHFDLLKKVARPDLPPYLHFRMPEDGEAKPSLGLAYNTRILDNLKPVSEQIDAVVDGLLKAAALRAWMFANEAALRRWTEAVTHAEGAG